MNFFLDLTNKILGLKLKKKKLGLEFFLGLIKSGASGECLTRLGFEPALLYGMSKIQITPSSQIPLKNSTNSVRCHISANKIATCVTLKK